MFLTVALGLIAGGLIIFFLTKSSFASIGINFFTEQNQQAAVKNFKELAHVMDAEMNEKEFTYILGHPFYLPSGFVIIGFSKESNILEDECQKEWVKKPIATVCKEACICLYKDKGGWSDDDLVGNFPLECSGLDADSVFALDYYDGAAQYSVKSSLYKNVLGKNIEISSKFYTDKYSSLFIYGECEDWGVDEMLGATKLYIEKVLDEGKTYIFVSDMENGRRYSSRLGGGLDVSKTA